MRTVCLSVKVVSILIEFASLTHAQLMEKVRALQNLAYRLGVEEGITLSDKLSA